MAFIEAEFAIIAYRGAASAGKPHSFESISRAVELGSDAILIDVNLSKDGKVVVVSEDQLPEDMREASVGKLTYRELRERLEVVLLTELLQAFVSKVKFLLSIEESRGVEKVIGLLKETNVLDRVALITSDISLAAVLKNLESNLTVGLRITHPFPNVDLIRRKGVALLLPAVNAVRGRVVREARAKGLQVFPWIINDVSQAIKMKNFGADGIITERPEIRRELSEIRTY